MVELKYGLFSSFLLFVWMVFEYTLLVPNYHELGSYIGIVAAIIPVIGIYLGIREKRYKGGYRLSPSEKMSTAEATSAN